MSTAMSTAALKTAHSADALDLARSGPSFAAALCGFLSTTVATTMLMFLLSSI